MHLEYFQMVDSVQSIDAHEGAIEVRACVPVKSPVFEGHFPGFEVLPGTLLIETMAQSAGFLMLARNGFGKLPFLAMVKEAKMRGFVEPGTELSVDARIEQAGSAYALVKAAIRAGGKRMCNATLMLSEVDFPTAELRDLVRARGRDVGLEVA